MSGGDIAGLIAAAAFVLLVGMLAVPLLKLGGVLDEARTAVRAVTEHTLPVIDEAAGLVASSNTQVARVDTIATSAAEVSQDVAALTALFSATVGRPLLKLAAFSAGVRRAFGRAR
ncbi:MAG: DUF948 domain-containing protein [Micrococcales bacterium]|nr:DUF948 domain-containing protein [Micrococcales bacterium]